LKDNIKHNHKWYPHYSSSTAYNNYYKSAFDVDISSVDSFNIKYNDIDINGDETENELQEKNRLIKALEHKILYIVLLDSSIDETVNGNNENNAPPNKDALRRNANCRRMISDELKYQHVLYYYKKKAHAVFDALLDTYKKARCCWEWMVILNCNDYNVDVNEPITTNKRNDDNILLRVINPRHIAKLLKKYENPTRFSYYFTSGDIINSNNIPNVPSKSTPYDNEKIEGGLQYPPDVNFGLLRNGIVISRGVMENLAPKLLKYMHVPMVFRHYSHIKSWCFPYIDNEINFGGCLSLELGISIKYLNIWSQITVNSKELGNAVTVEMSPNGSTKQREAENYDQEDHQETTILISVMGYHKDTDRSIAFFKALFKHKVYSKRHKFLFMHDDKGIMPKEIKEAKPLAFNLEVVPHPQVSASSNSWLRKFAQLKYIAVVLEAGKRMKANPHLKYFIATDNDVTINFAKVEGVLNKYMPHYKIIMGGTITYNYVHSGYPGGGVLFLTRKAVLSICNYILSTSHFPGSLIPTENPKRSNPMKNIDVYLSALVYTLGGEIINLPGAYSRSPYCGYPRKYLVAPIIAAQHSMGKANPDMPQHEDVLAFMLNFTGPP
jgi:hypothetical protein